MSKITEKILFSPLLQTLIDVGLTTIIGFFSATLITEITQNNTLIWGDCFSSFSLYILIIFVLLLALYKRFLLKSADEIDKFKDDEYCIAYARSQMLPEAAKKAVEKIKNGTGGELYDAMEEIKKVLK